MNILFLEIIKPIYILKLPIVFAVFLMTLMEANFLLAVKSHNCATPKLKTHMMR